MRLFFLLAASALLSWRPALAQEPVTGTVTVRQGGHAQPLALGFHPTATSGLDAALGESELPPMPPSGVFEARFVSLGDSVALGEGSYTDLRVGPGTRAARTFQVRFQRASGDPVTVEWALPPGLSVRARDLFGGAAVDQQMEGSGQFTVGSSAVEALRLEASYVLPVGTEAPGRVPPPSFRVWPSPASDYAAVALDLPAPGRVVLSLYDTAGRRVRVLADEAAGPGPYLRTVEVGGLPAGVYLLTVATPHARATRPLVVAR